MAFFSQKIIFTEILYETNDNKLLTIVEIFKIGKHNIAECKYQALIFLDHNNISYFMDTKSLSF